MRTKIILLLITALVSFSSVFAQRTTVYYNFAKNSFGDFQELPSEEYMLITGMLPPNCRLVEIKMYDDEVEEDDLLYTGEWTAAGTVGSKEFQVPINEQLRPGNEYTFRIAFYNTVGSEDRTELYEQVRRNIEAYLNLSYTVENEKLQLNNSPRKLRRELDQIIKQSMSQYRITSPNAFEGFSDIVLEQLKVLDGQPTADAKGNSGLQALAQLIDGELRSMLNQDVAVLRNERIIRDVKAKDKPGYFSIVGGYGAVYYGGDLDDLNYGDGAFVGLGFPFAATKVAPKFLRNASVSVGVFVNDLDIDGRDFTGPIVDRPIFLGFDYKLFSFVRFNAGAVFIEEDKGTDNMLQDIDTSVRMRPFIGLSAKLNLSISLDK